MTILKKIFGKRPNSPEPPHKNSVKTQKLPTVIDLPSKGHNGVDSFSVALIVEPASFEELLRGFLLVEARHHNGRCLLTLDDLNQCLYTSGHARVKHDLGSDVDIEGIDWQNPADRTRFDSASFSSAVKRLGSPERLLSWDAVSGVMTTTMEALVRLNAEPARVLDKLHVVQCLPANADADLLANIPNGYFVGDWTPFQCHAVVRRIAQHGYRFFGIGAAVLGFIRSADSQATDFDALTVDLQMLYGQVDALDAWKRLRATLATSAILLLGYSENFTELGAED